MVDPKRRIALLLVLLLLPMAANGSLAEDTQEVQLLRIEQAQMEMPFVDVYFYGPTLEETAPPSLWIGQNELTVTSVRQLSPDQDGAWLFCLVDCSTSVAPQQMKAIRSVLLKTAEQMNADDRMTLITFGARVEVLLEREQDPATIRAAIESLDNDQKGTPLYDALDKALQYADQQDASRLRELCFLFTDAINLHTGGVTTAEVERRLEESSLPIYAFGFSSGTNADLDAIGIMTRRSGGAMRVVTAYSLEEHFFDTYDTVRSAYALEARAESNAVGEARDELTLKAGALSAQRAVTIKHRVPDTEAPRMLSVGQLTPTTIRIAFSEPVIGATQAGNYAIRDADGNLLPVQAAATVHAPGIANAVDLTFAQPIVSQRISVECPGVTDASVEANAVANTTVLAVVTSSPIPTATPEGTPIPAPPPVLEAAEQLSDTTIRVYFDTMAAGVNQADAYAVRDEKRNLLPILAAAVATDTDRPNAVDLTFAQPLVTGSIWISCPGLVEPAVTAGDAGKGFALKIAVDEPETPAPAPEDTEPPTFSPEEQPEASFFARLPVYVWGLIAGLMAAILVAIALLLRRGRAKRKKAAEGEGAYIHYGGREGERRILQNTGKVHFAKPDLPMLRMTVLDPSGQPHPMAIYIDGSAFFGRSDICDVYFDDTTMSRQHFVIEEQAGAFLLTNTSETNQTRVNGVQVHKHRLEEGDRIEAGQQVIIFQGKA